MKNSRKLWEGWFSLEIPNDWIVSEDEDLLNIYDNKKGVGTIQVSFVNRNLEAAISEEEIIELNLNFAKSRLWKIEKKDIQIKKINKYFQSNYSYKDHEDNSTYWNISYFLDKTRLVFITYNCDLSDINKELNIIKKIVNSFSWDN